MKFSAVALISTSALTVAGCGGSSNPVVAAGEACDEERPSIALEVREDSVFIDMEGEDGNVEDGILAIQCVLGELDAPEYILDQMGGTRALDGRQSTSWDDITAEWTYHPDDGLDVLIYQSEE